MNTEQHTIPTDKVQELINISTPKDYLAHLLNHKDLQEVFLTAYGKTSAWSSLEALDYLENVVNGDLISLDNSEVLKYNIIPEPQGGFDLFFVIKNFK